MTGLMSFQDLERAADDGSIDTVLVCLVDMQGRLMGKRFHVRNFIDSAHRETHCCNYLLATDLEMATPDGYAATSWRAGYGDYAMRPDMATLRRVPWLDGTALILCDVMDHHGDHPVPHSPRQVLKTQIARLAALGYDAMMATELEFFLFDQSYRELLQNGYRTLRPWGDYNEDYSILQTTKEEPLLRRVRNTLFAAGIPVENTKGEAEAGQGELNIRYAGALDCADHHTIAKHAIKEIAHQQGVAASFLPKWHHQRVGSSSHVHMSLWQGDAPAFLDAGDDLGMSALMKHFVAGLIAHAADCIVFLAPYINSYKRFARGSFAPTRTAWSVDNRTAGFRLCGQGTKGIRIECRIGGSDMNPYLAQAALLAAGIKGIDAAMDLAPPTAGDVYADTTAAHIPTNLRDATDALRGSAMLRAAMGDEVVDHYVRCAEWEQEEFDRVVTDWEIARGFERA